MGSSATGTKAKDHSPEIRLNAFHVKPSTSDVISILELRMRSWKIEGLQTPGKQLRNSNRTRCVFDMLTGTNQYAPRALYRNRAFDMGL